MDTMFIFSLGLLADLITILLVLVDIILNIRTRYYSLDDKRCCKFEIYENFDKIPRRWMCYEGGGEEIAVDELVKPLSSEDKNEFYVFIVPYMHNVIRKVEIYEFNNLFDEKISIKKNYKLLKEYSSLSKPICINFSIGNALPGLIITWHDKYGKHMFFSNTGEIVHNFKCRNELF